VERCTYHSPTLVYQNTVNVLLSSLSKKLIRTQGIFYGTPQHNSLHLIKRYFEQYPEDASKVVLSIKGAFTMQTGPNGSPEGVRASVEEACAVLGGVKKIDVFEMARVDPQFPIETSVKALAELVKEDKIGGIGLSEVSANTIRKAHAVHPVSAVEVELSMFTPDPLTNGIVDTCHERTCHTYIPCPGRATDRIVLVGIPVVAYSPIGRGFLSGEFRKLDDMPENDFRRIHMPRFQADAFDQNVKLVEAVEKVAKRKGFTTAQVAIAWVVRQGAIPIPGSSKMERVVQNSKAVELSDEDMTEIQKILETMPVAGARYGPAHQKLLNA